MPFGGLGVIRTANAARTPSSQLPRGGVVDRLRHRSQRDSKRLQVRAQREVVVLVARKARQVEHDHEVHAALVLAAVRQEALELAAVRGLRALAFLIEAFENLVALATAVLFARLQLRRHTQVLGLLLRLPAEARSGSSLLHCRAPVTTERRLVLTRT